MNQFKVGDKVKYKENHKKVAGSNKHSPDKIYTISGINQNTENVFFDESVHDCWIGRLELASNNRHKHADLMIAYANDKSLKFQYREDESYKWTDCTIAPSFSETIQYRIKPKTATKYQVLYLMTEYNQANVTGDYFFDEEDFNSAGYTKAKFISMIKETAKEFQI